MTIWDKIYKKYKADGTTWATLGKGVQPLFLDFLKNTELIKKVALDLGCGDGRYLKVLAEAGFKVFGVDSSETAIELAKENLKDNSGLVVADFFTYEIVPNKFDLIISVRALHHGDKEKIKAVIRQVYSALIPGGKVFITLPDMTAVDKWQTFQKGQVSLAAGIFVPVIGPEKSLPHSFFKEAEIKELFADFHQLVMNKDGTDQWFIQATK